MCFQAAREEARTDNDGFIILLKDQDRSKWNKQLIERGKYYLETAAEGDQLSEYHLEAAIAAIHANASSFEKTDWNKILQLYEALHVVRPDPVVEMNKAIAEGYGRSFASGLTSLKQVKGMEHHHLYHSAMGDFYSGLNDSVNARFCYEKAVALTASSAEKKLLEEKIATLKGKAIVPKAQSQDFVI
jgi:RNA polymerase sigma-70 factor (ECF subfamily)